jgi:toxin HigB-1
MLGPDKIRSKALRTLFGGDPSGVHPKWRRRVERILAQLNVITTPLEMNLPGFGFHELKGTRKGTFAVNASGNWRITFKWDNEGPFEVELEDYHGR